MNENNFGFDGTDHWELWEVEMKTGRQVDRPDLPSPHFGTNSEPISESTHVVATSYAELLSERAIREIARITRLEHDRLEHGRSEIVFDGGGLSSDDNGEIVDTIVAALSQPGEYKLPAPTDLFRELDEESPNKENFFANLAWGVLNRPRPTGTVAYNISVNGTPVVLTVDRFHALGRDCYAMSAGLSSEASGAIASAEAVLRNATAAK